MYAQSPSRRPANKHAPATGWMDGKSVADRAIEDGKTRAVQMQQLAMFRSEQGDGLLLTLSTKELNEVLRAGDYSEAQVLAFKTARYAKYLSLLKATLQPSCRRTGLQLPGSGMRGNPPRGNPVLGGCVAAVACSVASFATSKINQNSSEYLQFEIGQHQPKYLRSTLTMHVFVPWGPLYSRAVPCSRAHAPPGMQPPGQEPDVRPSSTAEASGHGVDAADRPPRAGGPDLLGHRQRAGGDGDVDCQHTVRYVGPRRPHVPCC